MPCHLNSEPFLMSSDLIASQLLLEIAHCIPLSLQSVSVHLKLISSHVFSAVFTSSHLIPPHVFSAEHNCFHLFSCHLSFSHLFSSHLSLSQLFSDFHNSSQLFSTLLNSPQLISAHLLSSHLSPFLTSSKLFSHLLSWSQLLSARHTSSQHFSAHSQIISALLWAQTLLQTRISVPKQATPTLSTEKIWHREPLHTTSFCAEKLVHTEAFTQTQGSFYTETGKLVHRDGEDFTHNKLLHRASFYTQQVRTHSKLLRREAFTQRGLYTANIFTHSKLLHTEAFT